jgi:hypothetical protein
MTDDMENIKKGKWNAKRSQCDYENWLIDTWRVDSFNKFSSRHVLINGLITALSRPQVAAPVDI